MAISAKGYDRFVTHENSVIFQSEAWKEKNHRKIEERQSHGRE